MQVNQPITSVVPFKFDQEMIHKPTEFEFVFVADDGLMYVYGFSADTEKITEEYLYQYRTSKPTQIFERSGEEYRIVSNVFRKFILPAQLPAVTWPNVGLPQQPFPRGVPCSCIV